MKREQYADTVLRALIRSTSVAELKSEIKQKELARLSFEIADQMVDAEQGIEDDDEEEGE